MTDIVELRNAANTLRQWAKEIRLEAAPAPYANASEDIAALERIASLLVLFDDTSIANCGKIVGRSPILGTAFDTPVDVMGLECFDSDRGVAEILELQLIEIVLPDVHVKVLAPVVLDSLVDDAAPSHELFDPVGPAAERGR